MKKILSILLCIILCIATLSCNSTSAEKEQKKAKDSSTTDSSAPTQSSESTSTSTQNTELTESIQTTKPIDATDPNYLYVKEMGIEKIVITRGHGYGETSIEYCFPADSEKIKYVLDFLDSLVFTDIHRDTSGLMGGGIDIGIIYDNQTVKNVFALGDCVRVSGDYDGNYQKIWYRMIGGSYPTFKEFFATLE